MNVTDWLKKNESVVNLFERVHSIVNKKSYQIDLNKNLVDLEHENIKANMVSLTVNYLSRYLLLKKTELKDHDCKMQAFKIAELGATSVSELQQFNEFLNDINYEIDDKVVFSALKLAEFSIAYWRNDKKYKAYEFKKPNPKTIQNIKIMVDCLVSFFEKTEYKFYNCTLLFDGAYKYMNGITKGDTDFMSERTLWKLVVSKERKVSKKQIAQMIIYYLLAKKSDESKGMYKNVDSLGFINPRIGVYYLLHINDIDPDIIKNVEYKIYSR